MIYAVISDVHSNLPALERAVATATARAAEQFLCLGDVVGYGASPNECCALLRSLPGLCIRGNHDAAAVEPGRELWFTPAARQCIMWTRGVLTPESREFLAGLPPAAEVPGAELCHGSVPDPDLYTLTPEQATDSFEALAGQLAFFGHTHLAGWFEEKEPGRAPRAEFTPEGALLRLSEDRRYLINPGAVGQPRDGNPQASLALWDTEARTVEIVRFAYDLGEAQAKMRRVHLPESMASRLSLGV